MRKDNYNKRKYISNNRGQTTIFLTIIFIGILFFTGILVDGARMISGRVNVTRAVEDACVSALALYNSQLKKDYGIFALSENDSKSLKKTIETFLGNNLNINDSLNISAFQRSKQEYLIDIYDFKLEDLSVTPIFNLTNNQIVREQILEHMKYRGPKELGENILKKINILKDTGDMALLYEKKIELEKELADVDSIQRQLKKSISGTLGDDVFEDEYIEKFNLGGVRDKLIYNYINLIEEQTNLLSYIEEKRQYMQQLNDLMRECDLEPENKMENELEREQDNEHDNEQDRVSENDVLKMKAKEVEEEYSNAVNQLENIKAHISDMFEQLTNTYTKSFIDVNEDTIGYIEKLMEAGRKLSSDINELSKTAASSFDRNENETGEDENDPGKEFKRIFLDDIDSLKKLIPDYENGSNMIGILSSNVQALRSSLDILNYIHDKVMDEDTADIHIQEIKKALGEVNEKYKTIEFDYQVSGKSANKDDPRKDLAAVVKDTVRDLIAKGLDIQEKEIDFNELPSRKKVAELDFNKADEAYLDDFHKPMQSKQLEEDQQSSTAAEAAYQGDFSSIDEDIDLINVKGTFTNKIFTFINSIGKAIGSGAADIRDELYINQYIIDVFNSRVDTKNEVKNNGESEYRSSFQNEVEYILHGDRLEQLNVTKTAGQIAALRFGINTMQIYMDATKRKEAYSLATAIAGWWTGGAGIPIIANLILCSWGIVEGINDLKLLMAGEEVPVFKKSDIKFTYEDYLLLFLMLEDSDTKIDRIQDLIELNISKSKNDFKMSSTHCAIRVEAEVSMKYLFVTRSFMPLKLKTPEGRHKVKVLLYESY